jgi:MSHA biogenesis protein MshG
MASFHYQGVDTEGKRVTGVLEADDLEEALSLLERASVVPLDVTGRGGGSLSLGERLHALYWELTRPRVKLDDLILFTRQMATLTRAGVPLLRAIAGQIESTENERLLEALQGLRNHVEGGHTLADGLRHFPDVFPDLMVQMVRVGEMSGNLEQVFNRLSLYLEQEKDTRDKAKQAMRYPAMVITAIVVAFIILNVFVIPKFVDLFGGLGAELPLPTRFLIGMSNFVRDFGWVLALALGGGVVLGRRALTTDRGRWHWDRWKLRLPIIGNIFEMLAMARFTRTFATTSGSGVPLVEGLQIIARTVGNRYIGDYVEDMRERIARGDSLTNCARRTGLFPVTVLQMLQVGEESGAVDEMMEQVAEYYEREVAIKIDNLSSLIEPVLIAVIGALVLVLALGIFLPMWNMSQAMG